MKCEKCGRDFEVGVSGISYEWMAGNRVSVKTEGYLNPTTITTYTDFLAVSVGLCIDCFNEIESNHHEESLRFWKRSMKFGLPIGIVLLIPGILLWFRFFGTSFKVGNCISIVFVVGFVITLIYIFQIFRLLFFREYKPIKVGDSYLKVDHIKQLQPFLSSKLARVRRKYYWTKKEFEQLKKV